MANDAVLQVRIDAQLKSEVEQLYRQMGTTFPEAVRLFARQSLIRRRLPFEVTEADMGGSRQAGNRTLQRCSEYGNAIAQDASPAHGESGFGMFAAYAGDQLRASEYDAWQLAAVAKHAPAAEPRALSSDLHAGADTVQAQGVDRRGGAAGGACSQGAMR